MKKKFDSASNAILLILENGNKIYWRAIENLLGEMSSDQHDGCSCIYEMFDRKMIAIDEENRLYLKTGQQQSKYIRNRDQLAAMLLSNWLLFVDREEDNAIDQIPASVIWFLYEIVKRKPEHADLAATVLLTFVYYIRKPGEIQISELRNVMGKKDMMCFRRVTYSVGRDFLLGNCALLQLKGIKGCNLVKQKMESGQHPVRKCDELLLIIADARESDRINKSFCFDNKTRVVTI